MTNLETRSRAGRALRQDCRGGRGAGYGPAGKESGPPQSRKVRTESQPASGRVFFENGIRGQSNEGTATDDYTRIATGMENRQGGMGTTAVRYPVTGALRTFDLVWIVPCICLVWAWMALCDLVMGAIELFEKARARTGL